MSRMQRRLEGLVGAGLRYALRHPWIPIPFSQVVAVGQQRVALWDLITSLPLLRRHILLTVQVIVICLETQEVLVIWVPHCPGKCTLIEGLADWQRFGWCQPEFTSDPRLDAARELNEEAFVRPVGEHEIAFRFSHRNGPFRQFLALVYVLIYDRADAKPKLRAAHAEGRPAWLKRAEIHKAFEDPRAASMVEQVFACPSPSLAGRDALASAETKGIAACRAPGTDGQVAVNRINARQRK